MMKKLLFAAMLAACGGDEGVAIDPMSFMPKLPAVEAPVVADVVTPVVAPVVVEKPAAPTQFAAGGSRGNGEFVDVTMEPDPGPPPEAVFDRVTGPFDRRRAVHAPGAADEET
jgi:hypothetical protein